ncbi:MAG: CvpA family protein [Lachnospiraceae bacterium]|nr:CvpA family protein [Lachnospiraceae bacterium]
MELFLVIGVIAILGIGALVGYARGFLHIVLSFVALFVASIVATILTDPVSQLVSETPVYESITENVQQYVSDNLELGVTNAAEVVEQNVLENLKLPSVLTDKVNEELLNMQESLTTADEIAACITDKLTGIVLATVAFLFIFLLVLIALKVVIVLADLVSRLPGLKSINRTLGLALGVVQGIIVIWIACMVLTMFSGTETGMELLQAVHANPFLNFIYSNNILMNILTSMIA